MKILLVGPVPPDLGSHNAGGIARHVWALAKRLQGSGNEVCVLAIGRYFKQTCAVDGIMVYGIEKSLRGLARSLKYAPQMVSEMRSIPQKKSFFHALYSLLRMSTVDNLDEYDIIHLHGLHNAGLYALKVLNINVPKIVSIHSYTGYISSNKTKSEKKISHINNYLKLADGIVHVSKADKAKGQRYGLMLANENEIIHNGVEGGRKHSFECKAGICFVGYLIASKRIGLLLDSLKYVQCDIRKVKIAGDGSQRQKVKSVAAANAAISYRGVISNEEVRKMMNEQSVLVVPSLSESFGLVYVEALFEGMAVLGYGPVIEEFQAVMNLTEDEKKLVVPIAPVEISPQELAPKVDAVFELRRTPKGQELMKRIQQKAIDTFGWDFVINKMTNFYKRIIRRKSKR